MTTIEQIRVLEADGFFVGLRDPKVMPGDAGRFMVWDKDDPDQDYCYCVVGDSLSDLVSRVWAECGYDLAAAAAADR